MAHATGSPLYQALEMLIEEQVGRDRDCPGGAGVLRSAGTGACVNRRTGIAETGSGGALWCVNCHAPGENLAPSLPAWSAFDERSRRPLRDLLPASAQQGISCAFCHQVTGPARPGSPYEGNPSWISSETGQRFSMRPEDERGRFGIANSGYLLDVRALLGGGSAADLVAGGAHRASSASARAYLGSSEFCGSCHDVRLFGTDALEGVRRGEHFKRLRNAYSEWVAWADDERRAGRVAASCQDCHMSLYPGVCVPGKPDDGLAGRTCPPGTRFAAVPPGTYATGASAASSDAARLHGHSFTGVDLPLDPGFDARGLDDASLDVDGVPVGAKQRRDLLLARTFRLSIDGARRSGGRLELPITVENIGAGHRVPAGFSQEREFWLHVRVTDARGVVRYEAGRIDRATDDLKDKLFLRINTAATSFDGLGRPLGLFGADVADGPDAPQWTADGDGTSTFRGRGLVNFQNGFLRCVRCIGEIDARGRCQPRPGQERTRTDRFSDGDYDADTGECRSNLRGANAFAEIFFPVGALDATQGFVRGPDAIVDTRSLAPGVPQRYVHELDIPDTAGPLRVEVTLRFRAFPPYLIRAFIDYEREQQRLGLRPSGPLVDARALERLDIVDVADAVVELP
ncbi:MAG TPA: hypothetical protein VM261_02705 [Kofleriaceae bacterium]|nr:hypothetical protein [Kofleriaceae bacterium]